MFRIRSLLVSTISLALFAGGYFIFIKSGGVEKANDALVSAGQSSDKSSDKKGSIEETFDKETFGEALDALKEQAGSNNELVELTVISAESVHKVDIILRKASNDSAFGYSWQNGKVLPVEVDIIGTGSLKEKVIPLSSVPDSAIERVINGLERKVKKIDKKPESLTLERGFEGIRWTGTYSANGRSSLVFSTKINGTGLTLTK